MYKANPAYPLFQDIQNIVKKHLGIDKIIKDVIERLGNVDQVYLTGAFAEGRDATIIDLVLVGDIKIKYLTQLIAKVEGMIGRKIRYVHYTLAEWSDQVLNNFEGHPLLIWQKGMAI